MLDPIKKSEYFEFLKTASEEDIKDFINKKNNKEDYLFQEIRKLPILSFERMTVLDVLYSRKDDSLLKSIIEVYSQYNQVWSLNNNNSLLKQAINDKRDSLFKYLTEDLMIGLNPEESLYFFKKINSDALLKLIKNNIFYEEMFSVNSLVVNPEYNIYYKLCHEKNLNESTINNLKCVAFYLNNELNKILLHIYKQHDSENSPVIDLLNTVFEGESIILKEGYDGNSFLKYLIDNAEFDTIEYLMENNILPLNSKTSDNKGLWNLFKDIDLDYMLMSLSMTEKFKSHVEQLQVIYEKFKIEDALQKIDSHEIKPKKRM